MLGRLLTAHESAIDASAVKAHVIQMVMSFLAVSSSDDTFWRSFRSCRRACLASRPVPSSHHWSREPQALGHTVRPMPPTYVTPYVKRYRMVACVESTGT